MPKKFDCEDEPNEHMECPCMCDCGQWFDLEDGYSDDQINKVVCKNCIGKKESEGFSDFLKNGKEINYPADFKSNPLFNRNE
jgi:hypothetical protein